MTLPISRTVPARKSSTPTTTLSFIPTMSSQAPSVSSKNSRIWNPACFTSPTMVNRLAKTISISMVFLIPSLRKNRKKFPWSCGCPTPCKSSTISTTAVSHGKQQTKPGLTTTCSIPCSLLWKSDRIPTTRLSISLMTAVPNRCLRTPPPGPSRSLQQTDNHVYIAHKQCSNNRQTLRLRKQSSEPNSSRRTP